MSWKSPAIVDFGKVWQIKPTQLAFRLYNNIENCVYCFLILSSLGGAGDTYLGLVFFVVHPSVRSYVSRSASDVVTDDITGIRV